MWHLVDLVDEERIGKRTSADERELVGLVDKQIMKSENENSLVLRTDGLVKKFRKLLAKNKSG
jgi:hypothetical protein